MRLVTSRLRVRGDNREEEFRVPVGEGEFAVVKVRAPANVRHVDLVFHDRGRGGFDTATWEEAERACSDCALGTAPVLMDGEYRHDWAIGWRRCTASDGHRAAAAPQARPS